MISQIIACSVSVVVALLIILFFNKLPKKMGRAIVATLLFVFSAILLTNYLRDNIVKLSESDLASYIVLGFLVFAFGCMSFAVVYFVKDEEKQRKIFFWVAVSVFAIAYILHFTISTVNGLLEGTEGTFSGHLCRQIGYLFPIIYFSKHARKFFLPYFIFAAFAGAVATLYVPENILHNSLNWTAIDSVMLHLLLLWLPIIIVRTKEFRPVLWSIVHFTIGLAISAVFALICNAIILAQTGKWGNEMYLTEPPLPWFPTWLLTLSVFLLTIIIILAFNGKTIYSYAKNKKTRRNKIPQPKETNAQFAEEEE